MTPPPSHPIQNTDYIVSSHWRCGGGPITETSPHNVQLESALIRLQPLISSTEAHWSHIAVCRCWCSCAACPRVTREIDAVMTSCRVTCHVSRVTCHVASLHCTLYKYSCPGLAVGWRWRCWARLPGSSDVITTRCITLVTVITLSSVQL